MPNDRGVHGGVPKVQGIDNRSVGPNKNGFPNEFGSVGRVTVETNFSFMVGRYQYIGNSYPPGAGMSALTQPISI